MQIKQVRKKLDAISESSNAEEDDIGRVVDKERPVWISMRVCVEEYCGSSLLPNRTSPIGLRMSRYTESGLFCVVNVLCRPTNPIPRL